MNQALDQNHHVTALVRSPEKVTVQHENLKVEKCDIFSLKDMKTKCVDADVVISCLGAFGKNKDGNVEGTLWPYMGPKNKLAIFFSALRCFIQIDELVE